jgi:methylated-DNA-[protein]-cysteine S-methyltransferase
MTTAARYRIHPSPVGDILIVAAGDALVTLHPMRADADHELAHVAAALGSAPLPVGDRPGGDGPGGDGPVGDETDAEGERDVTATAAAQLDEYFAGQRRAFDLPLDWRLVRGFTRAALEAVCEIPYAETAGYGEVAILAGSPRAARAVGTACATTPFSIVVPVHRVVRADGSLGEYGGQPEVKRFLVDLERAHA